MTYDAYNFEQRSCYHCFFCEKLKSESYQFYKCYMNQTTGIMQISYGDEAYDNNVRVLLHYSNAAYILFY